MPKVAEKKAEPIIVQELLRYEFSDAELKQKSRDLARAVQMQSAAQEEREGGRIDCPR